MDAELLIGCLAGTARTSARPRDGVSLRRSEPAGAPADCNLTAGHTSA
jgi:hypothetical protein